jgi:hypothetical protein
MLSALRTCAFAPTETILVFISVKGRVGPKIKSVKNPYDPIAKRPRDLPACSSATRPNCATVYIVPANSTGNTINTVDNSVNNYCVALLLLLLLLLCIFSD